MAGSINRVTLMGNLGQDPEVRHLQDGRIVVQLSLATTESWKDKASGERKEHTDWHRVVIFNQGLAKVAEMYLKKGSKALVEGALKTRKWQDQNGQDRYSTEVVVQPFNGTLVLLGDSRGGRASDNDEGYTGGYRAPDMDDDIPF